MSEDCETVNVPISGKNDTTDPGNMKFGAKNPRTKITVSMDWCTTHNRPHFVCQEIE